MTSGLLARRINDPGLFHLDFADLVRHDGPRAGWREIHRGSLGNILLLERRVVRERIVLSCERGAGLSGGARCKQHGDSEDQRLEPESVDCVGRRGLRRLLRPPRG